MALGQHNVRWFETQNQALGLPPGTRHSDEFYRRAHAEAQARQRQAQQQHQWGLQDTIKEQQHQASLQQHAAREQAAREQAARDQAAKEKLAAEAAAFAKKRDNDMQRRDEWDRLNKQGIYDPDGWQPIGYQPDPIAIPDWWLESTAGAPPAAPPAPPAPDLSSLNSHLASLGKPAVSLRPGVTLPTGGGGEGIVVPGTTPRPAFTPTPGAPVATTKGGSGENFVNALLQTRGAQAQPQPGWGASNAGQAQPKGAWGAWGQRPSFTQKPDAGAWGQNSRPQSWMGPGAMGSQRDPSKWVPGRRPWGQKPAQAGTWGAGSL